MQVFDLLILKNLLDNLSSSYYCSATHAMYERYFNKFFENLRNS